MESNSKYSFMSGVFLPLKIMFLGLSVLFCGAQFMRVWMCVGFVGPGFCCYWLLVLYAMSLHEYTTLYHFSLDGHLHTRAQAPSGCFSKGGTASSRAGTLPALPDRTHPFPHVHSDWQRLSMPKLYILANT